MFQIEVDGKKSIRSLTGLRRDSEVMYVGTYETNPQQPIGRRGKISDVWGTLSKAQSTPDLLGDRKYGVDVEEEEEEEEESTNVIGETVLLQEPASIFNRPGFGSVAFRRSVSFRKEEKESGNRKKSRLSKKSLFAFEMSTLCRPLLKENKRTIRSSKCNIKNSM